MDAAAGLMPPRLHASMIKGFGRRLGGNAVDQMVLVAVLAERETTKS
jgi:hypothetical protein